MPCKPALAAPLSSAMFHYLAILLLLFSVSAMLGTGTSGRMVFSSTKNAVGWQEHEDSSSDASLPSIIIVANNLLLLLLAMLLIKWQRCAIRSGGFVGA